MMDLNICGVYRIKNRITGDIYIGSSNNVHKRFKGHIGLLKKNNHHSSILQHSYNKYGHDNFSFELICKCDNSLQYILEQSYIDSMKPYFNISKIALHLDYSWFKREGFCSYMKGRIPWNKGIPRTEEEKSYMSIRKKAAYDKLSPEKKLKIIERQQSKEYRANMRQKAIENNQYLFLKEATEKAKKQVIDCSGNLFPSLSDCAYFYESRVMDICDTLRGRSKALKGKYKLWYYEEFSNSENKSTFPFNKITEIPEGTVNENNFKYTRKRKVVDNLGNHFESVNEAAAYYKTSPTNISNILTGKNKTLNSRYSFKYEDDTKQLPEIVIKICNVCNLDLPLVKFAKKAKIYGGRYDYCINCRDKKNHG